MRILQIAQIPFKILADEEVCCGDTVHRVGDFSTAKKVRKINKENILKNNIEKMYVLSPHCFSTFKDTFNPEEMKNIKIAPLIELIHQLISSSTIQMTGKIEKKVAFHDPCFFSKHLDIINQPREILQMIPGVEIVEMEHYGKKSLCCGGGGGGIWRDVKKGERLSEIRLDEALAVGAQAVVTNCPYCLSMLDDARQGDEKYQMLEIMDIFELIGKGMSNENN
jgi:Fe-S oxidoreductase